MLRFAGGNILATGFGTILVYVNSALDPSSGVLENVAVWGIGAVIVAFILIQREVSRILKGVDLIQHLETRIVKLEAKVDSGETLLKEVLARLEANENNHRRR